MRLKSWLGTLTDVRILMEEWLFCQIHWMRFRPVFSVDDITRHLPSEARYFGVVENTLNRAAHHVRSTPRVMDIIRLETMMKGTA